MSLQAVAQTLLLTTLIAAPADAYTVTTTADQNLVRLRYGQKLFVAGNPARPGGFSADFFRNSVVRALSQWKWATQGVFDFEYWQGTDKKTYEPSLARNGLSSVFFASNSNEPTDPNVIGYTQVWYNASTGDIVEADVLLNDRNYDLTTTETDTSSQSGRLSARPKVFIGNILTHEIGHALGLSHSGHLNSSMLYVEFSEQARIGCDDWAGARHLYPAPEGGQGSLNGVIVSPVGDPVPGVSVTAISQARGIPIATVVTDQSGRFDFAAIEAGTVALMLEKFPGASTTIPSRMAAKSSQPICNGSAYPTQFIAGPDGHQLQEFPVVAGQAVQAGTIRLHCQTVQNSRVSVFTADRTDFVVDQGQIGMGRTYRFMANGPFQVAGIGHLLLSPVKVSLQAYDSKGKLIATQAQTPIYQGRSSFQIEDTILKGNAQGWVDIRVVPSAISTSRFPTPALWPNSTPFYVLAFNSQAGRAPASSLPDNARCTPPEELPQYQSPPGAPIRNYADRTSRDAMGCGQAAEAGTFDGPVERDAGSIAGRLLPFGLIGLVWLYFRRRALKLEA